MKHGVTLIACAWILWRSAFALTPALVPGTTPLDRLTSTWEPEGTYETKEECEKAKAGLPQGKRVCLPDTVNPRG